MAEESPKAALNRIIGNMRQQVAAVFDQPISVQDQKAARNVLRKAGKYIHALQEAKWEGFESDLIKTAKAISENPILLIVSVLAFPYALATGDSIIGSIAPNQKLHWQHGRLHKAVDRLQDPLFKGLMQEFSRVAKGVQDLEIIKAKRRGTLDQDPIETPTEEVVSYLDKLAEDFKLSTEDREILRQTYETVEFYVATSIDTEFIPKLQDGLKTIERRLTL